MSKIIQINNRLATDETTGFGTNNAMYGRRFMNKDGRPNIRLSGIHFLESLSPYHYLIQMSRWKFLTFIFSFFILFNLLFACLYLLLGIEHLSGITAYTPAQKFIEAFFFSAQTFTTVGYGRINPTGYSTSFLASLEAFSGLLFFALATGLFYARFAQPKAYLRFSNNTLIAPFKDGLALMYRMAPYKNNYLTDTEVTLTLAVVVNDNGRLVNRFYPLELEYSKVNALSLAWTVVHPINERSPLYDWTEDDFKNTSYELHVYVKAFDDVFSNQVVVRTSYAKEEFVCGGKFIPMYRRSENGETTILELDKLSSFEKTDVKARLNKGPVDSTQKSGQ
jgi:inward rectifier potassium channel